MDLTDVLARVLEHLKTIHGDIDYTIEVNKSNKESIVIDCSKYQRSLNFREIRIFCRGRIYGIQLGTWDKYAGLIIFETNLTSAQDGAGLSERLMGYVSGMLAILGLVTPDEKGSSS